MADFAVTLPFPGLVGEVLARGLPDLSPDEILPRYLSGDEPNIAVFGKCFASVVFHSRGWDWVETLELAKWSVAAAKEFLLILPGDARTWELAKSLGENVEDAYWKTVLPYPRNKSAEEATTAVRHLLDYNRPLVAAEYIGFVYHNGMTLPANILAETLEESLPALNEAAENKQSVSHAIHELEELLGLLQEAPENDPVQVAQLEWAYLPVMRSGHASPKLLQQELGRNPSLFVQCVELIDPQNGEPDGGSIDREDVAGRARLAHELLDSWRTHPALNEDGGPNAAALHSWIDAVRRGCAKSQRTDAGDYQLGKLLASSPREPDGSWPCVAVRDALEGISGDSALRSFEIAIFNRRGITTHSIHEGGDQERNLAAKYHSHADACQIRWPRVAASLRSLARGYESDARHMDERADDDV